MFKDKIFIADENPNDLEKIFRPEVKGLNTERFSYKMEKQDNGVVFHVEAKDKIGFKIITTSINKLLHVYTKMKDLSEV
jgi:tRNA threonylcarbamoyladenosine modification (KEOPS) complex  Pcc1 subunit